MSTGFPLRQKVLFVLGKGGTGRSTVASALALSAAARGERVLVVQWSLHDALAGIFASEPAGHRARCCHAGIETMNYEFPEALREYFVSHLQLPGVFEGVIRNRHVRKLIEAAPGLPELFFLGRIFWLAELALGERGWAYDRIVVDAPASGHGVGLFELPRSVAGMGIAGPLASESARVARFLGDESKVGVLLVAQPEELPAREALELLERLRAARSHGPACVVLNRAIDEDLWNPSSESAVRRAARHLQEGVSRDHVLGMAALLEQRREIGIWLEQELCERGVAVVPVPDLVAGGGGVALASAVAEVLERWGNS